MVTIFSKDDEGFNQWIEEHPTGYVYNDFGGKYPAYKIVHQVGCSSFNLMNTQAFPKVCCEKLNELIDWLIIYEGQPGEDYVPCGKCNPF